MALRLSSLPPQLAASSRATPLSWARALSPEQEGLLRTVAPSGRCIMPLLVQCTIDRTVGATSIAQGTPVRPTSLLVIGATETLGSQVVRKALDERYDVRCLERPRPAPADFLCDSGATVVNVEKKLELSARVLFNILNKWRHVQVMTVIGLMTCTILVIPSAEAIDSLKTCSCLLKECRLELVKCISNPSCAANIACLQTCNDRPDETECQIKCGDLFENNVVAEFNECAVSRKKCVPMKSDIGEFPVPDASSLVKSFDISDFSGKWYITSGLNPTFDTFDCQLHEFHVESNRLIGNISWRIQTPDGGFFTRSTTQRFVQDPLQPGILYNHDNDYLHYQDDWYILSSKITNEADDYIFIYYRGRNDAWDGYGGAVVYTRNVVLPETIIPELERAAKSVGRDFSKFIRTDNTCGLEPPLVERLEKTVEEGEKTIIREVEEIEGEIEGEVELVGKTEATLVQRLSEGFMEIKRDVENFLRGLNKEEMELLSDLKMEAIELEKVFGRSLPIRKLR